MSECWPREKSNHVIDSKKKISKPISFLGKMWSLDWKSVDVRTSCQRMMPYHATWYHDAFIWIRHVRTIRQDEWILHRHQTCHSFNWLELFSTDWTYTCIWHSIYYLMHAFGQHNQLSDSFVSFARFSPSSFYCNIFFDCAANSDKCGRAFEWTSRGEKKVRNRNNKKSITIKW